MNLNTRQSAALVGAVFAVIIVIGLLAYKKSCGSKKSTKEAEVAALHLKIQEQEVLFEKALEKMHELGFDQGYQTAIWDVFMGNAQYIVQDGDSDGDLPTLWKRTQPDPVNMQTVKQFLGIHDEELTEEGGEEVQEN